MLGIVGGADFIIGMRLHTLIYAAKTGTPVIGLTYDPKVNAVMGYMGQDLIENVEKVNPLSIRRYIDKIVSNRQALVEKLTKAGQESEVKAKENTRLALELLDSCK